MLLSHLLVAFTGQSGGGKAGHVMAPCVEFCLLGPMVVRCGGVSVSLPRGRQRTLLAVLLLRRGRALTADELAELLWAPGPVPRSAAVTVRTYVKRLRQSLGPAGSDRIVTAPGGYLIRVEPGELDTAVMEKQLAAARASARAAAWDQAAVQAGAALGLWRGDPLADAELPPLAAQEAERLTELRLQARELRIEADLALGGHAEAVTELPQLIAANPVREHLYALLMRAYYRCGRRAEALDTYRAARNVLAEEIGADPGPELQALHQQILHDDTGRTSRLVRPVGGPRRPRDGCGATAAARGRRLLHRPGGGASGTDRAAGPGRRSAGRNGGDLGDRRDSGGGQDRAGRALGPPGRRPVRRRPAVCEPARL
jgi:DNA-binding SARP family transcriptional activator